MFENKKTNALIILGLIALAVVLTIIEPTNPACMSTGKDYVCAQIER